MDMMSPLNCTSFNLRKAARAVTQLYDDALKPTGLRSTQVTIMMVLDSSGPLSMTELAELLVMDRTTLTRNLKPLLTEDIVAVQPGADKRQRQVDLTKSGRTRLKQATPLWEDVQQHLASAIGKKRYQGMVTDLRHTVDAALSIG